MDELDFGSEVVSYYPLVYEIKDKFEILGW